MGSQPAAPNAEIDVAVVCFRSFVLLAQVLEEHVTTFGGRACACNREVVDEETDNAVVVDVRLVDETTWVGW